MRLFGKIDSAINTYDRAQWMTPPFDRPFGSTIQPEAVESRVTQVALAVALTYALPPLWVTQAVVRVMLTGQFVPPVVVGKNFVRDPRAELRTRRATYKLTDGASFNLTSLPRAPAGTSLRTRRALRKLAQNGLNAQALPRDPQAELRTGRDLDHLADPKAP